MYPKYTGTDKTHDITNCKHPTVMYIYTAEQLITFIDIQRRSTSF
jgi:hypothetical protein